MNENLFCFSCGKVEVALAKYFCLSCLGDHLLCHPCRHMAWQGGIHEQGVRTTRMPHAGGHDSLCFDEGGLGLSIENENRACVACGRRGCFYWCRECSKVHPACSSCLVNGRIADSLFDEVNEADPLVFSLCPTKEVLVAAVLMKNWR